MNAKDGRISVAVLTAIMNTNQNKKVVVKKQKVFLQPLNFAFVLVSTIQEEVHRFAIGYHRKRRANKSISTTLTEIEGVGELTAKKLLQHFKTVAAIKQASVEEIGAVKAIPITTAIRMPIINGCISVATFTKLPIKVVTYEIGPPTNTVITIATVVTNKGTIIISTGVFFFNTTFESSAVHTTTTYTVSGSPLWNLNFPVKSSIA